MRLAAGSRPRAASPPLRTEPPLEPIPPSGRARSHAIEPRRRCSPGRALPVRIGWGTALALLVGVAAAPAANAGSRIPYGGAFREEIESALFAPGPDDVSLRRVSPPKLEAWRESVRQRLRFISQHVYNAERIDGGESHDDALKTAASLDSVIAFEHVLDLLDRLEAASDPPEAYDIAAEILTLDYAVRSHTIALQSLEVPIHVKNFAIEWSLPPGTRARNAGREATNLVNPETGDFYTPDELAALIRAGTDLSTLDPPKESVFWRAKDDIASVDLIENYLMGGDPVHEGLPAVFPPFEGAELDYRRAHKTQTKPKVDVFWRDADCRTKKKSKQRKCRRKYKLKFGMETHADPIGNALLSALGFNVDVSAHLRTLPSTVSACTS
jgi:hypothetical protein